MKRNLLPGLQGGAIFTEDVKRNLYICPKCGTLTDTIAADIKDNPSTENFEDPFKNYYKEDIQS